MNAIGTIIKRLALATLLVVCVAAHGVAITDEPFNAAPDDGKDDTAAIQGAIDALHYGGRVVIPAGTFNVSMAGGITIKSSYIKLIIRGDLAVTTEGKESPDCTNLFTITDAYCHIVGEGGMVRGQGKPFVGGKCPKVHRTMQHPRFFYAVTSARHCVIEKVHMRDPAGGFAAFIGVKDCRLSHCKIEGGSPQDIKPPPPGPYSRYLGVSIIGATGMMIQGNHFNYYQGRGMFSWIAASGSNRHPGTLIIGNVFEGGYDHAIYCSGLVKSVVANNTSRDSVGAAIKPIGDDLIVTGNSVYNCRYGCISTPCGSRNIIAHNAVYGFGHRGISITPYGGGTRAASPNTDNIVQGNILIGLTDKDAPPVMSAIYVESPDHVSRCKVAGNIIHNTGTGNAALGSEQPGEPARRDYGQRHPQRLQQRHRGPEPARQPDRRQRHQRCRQADHPDQLSRQPGTRQPPRHTEVQTISLTEARVEHYKRAGVGYMRFWHITKHENVDYRNTSALHFLKSGRVSLPTFHRSCSCALTAHHER